jgi:hypothetical protein
MDMHDSLETILSGGIAVTAAAIGFAGWSALRALNERRMQHAQKKAQELAAKLPAGSSVTVAVETPDGRRVELVKGRVPESSDARQEMEQALDDLEAST